MARKPSFRRIWCLLLLVVLIGAAIGAYSYLRQPQQWLAESESALRKGMYHNAEYWAARAMERLDDKDKAAWIAAQAAFAEKRYPAALQYLDLVENPAKRQVVQMKLVASQSHLAMGKAAEAERLCREVLELEPDNLQAHTGLSELMRMEGRSYEAIPHLATIIRSGNATEHDLGVALSTESIYEGPDDAKAAQRLLAAAPQDPLPLLSRARSMAAQQQYESATKVLLKIVEAHPTQPEALAALGHIYLETGNDEAFRKWLAMVDDAAVAHPGIWVNRGIWEQGKSRPPQAARCFWEAVRLDPNRLAANYLLAQQLAALNRADDAKPFADRAELLTDLLQLAGASHINATHLQRLVTALLALGRRPEAEAWRQFAISKKQLLAGFDQAIEFDEGSALVDERDNPALRIDLSDLPLPAGENEDASHSELSDQVGGIRFEERAEAAGVVFQHFNGADPTGSRVYMFELNGGAAAVMDYDADDWPDLYLTQGAPWPLDPRNTEHRDRLFRNQGDGTFRDVSEQAGLGDTGLSQAAAVGDIDNDGFPDLYIGNIGANTFYRNNGDGAFDEQPLPAAMAVESWTSACGWADLNGDGWPDLYVVNYLAGPEVYDRECFHRGRPVQCHPHQFAGEQDRLFLSQGDGTFRDATDLIRAKNGKGLGLIIADLDKSGDLDVFVANDGVPNFAFQNQLAATGAFRFGEQAVLMGLALDERGFEQACMGIALDDFDQDGMYDLFVTNFYKEANTLYRQASPGAFVDGTRNANLRQTSYYAMGWGTQFFDAELDGDLDLIVANGHLNDYTADGEKFKMRAQIFRADRGVYQDVSPQTLGPYFEIEQLGRGVARADWDNDGLEDFCVTRVDGPTALLFNRSPRQGGSVSVRLSARTTARDAIGARVRVKAGELDYERQLASGDGFAASNQRQLNFGLGKAASVDELEVFWPSGRTQKYVNLPINGRWLIVEGADQPAPLP